MQKRVFIVHGWDGTPDEGWFPWLKQELEGRGFMVTAPVLPNSSEPRIHTWVPALAEVVGDVDEQTFFVGHSIGCQTIIRYCESLAEGKKIGGAVFVAGFFKDLLGLDDDEVVQSVAKEWLGTPIDIAKVRTHLKKSVAIFSDNDPDVSITNAEEFKVKLGSMIVMDEGKGHFSWGEGVMELPSALKAVLEVVGE